MDEDDAQENVRRQRNRVLKAFAVATVCHVLIFSGASQLKKVPSSSGKAVASGPLSVVFLDREDARAQKERAPQEPKKKEAKKDPMPKGQVVALPPDRNALPPEQADYLSETHHRVEHESRSRFASAKPDLAPAYELQVGAQAEKTQVGEDDRFQAGQGKVTRRKQGAVAPSGADNEKGTTPLMLALAQRQAQDALKLKMDIDGRAVNQIMQQALRGNAPFDRVAVAPTTGAASGRDGNPNPGEGGDARQGTIANLIPSFVELSEWSGAPQNDYLPEVETEDATRLNTWEFQHAPFFNRIANGVRRTWKPGFAIRRNDPQFEVYGSQNRRTVLSVTINRDGQLQAVDIFAASGAMFLDDEAVRAFKTAAPFPNPPRGLFGKEETFTFNFGFNVDYQKPWQLDMNWQPYK